VDATVGGASSNSYVTLAAAEAYFLGRLSAEAWDDADGDDDKEAALIMATARLESEPYTGYRATTTQRLQWPRYSTYDRNGNMLASTTIPQLMQDATCEMALAILKDPDMLGGANAFGEFQNLRIGNSLDITPASQQVGALPMLILRLIAPLRLGGFMNRVVRA
jgi:DnaT-like ssDNA binding protein